MSQLILGIDQNTGQPVYFPRQARAQGSYLVGVQGSGKTQLLVQIALADIEQGDGLCVLSPHADLIEEILLRIPSHREDDVIILAPYDSKPVGFRVFGQGDQMTGAAISKIADEVVNDVFARAWKDVSWGPEMERMLRNTTRTIAYAQCVPEAHRPTLMEMIEVVGVWDTSYRDYLFEHIETHHSSYALDRLARFWNDFGILHDERREQRANSTINKVEPFITNELVSHLLGQGHLARLDFEQVMGENKILLVDLSVKQMTPLNVELVGSLLVGRLFSYAIARDRQQNLKPFHIIADEFSFFASKAFSELQDQVRKFGVDTLVAHQRRGQLDGDTRDATLTSRNWIVFAVNPQDAATLATGFERKPPEPEIRGYRQGLELASAPWDTLKQRAHESQEVMDQVYWIDSRISVKLCWDMSAWVRSFWGLEDREELVFKVWGFPDKNAEDRWVTKLNRVLYLMMVDQEHQRGDEIEPLLLSLGNELYLFWYGYLDRYELIEPRDPPIDWEASALDEVEDMIRHSPRDDVSSEFARLYHNVKEMGGVQVRLRLRWDMIRQIAKLGYLLNREPVWERGGQPVVDYERRESVMNITGLIENELVHLPNREAWVKIQGVGEHHIRTVDTLGVTPDGQRTAQRIRQASRDQYGVDRGLIDQALRARIQIPARHEDGEEGIPATGSTTADWWTDDTMELLWPE